MIGVMNRVVASNARQSVRSITEQPKPPADRYPPVADSDPSVAICRSGKMTKAISDRHVFSSQFAADRDAKEALEAIWRMGE